MNRVAYQIAIDEKIQNRVSDDDFWSPEMTVITGVPVNVT